MLSISLQNYVSHNDTTIFQRQYFRVHMIECKDITLNGISAKSTAETVREKGLRERFAERNYLSELALSVLISKMMSKCFALYRQTNFIYILIFPTFFACLLPFCSFRSIALCSISLIIFRSISFRVSSCAQLPVYHNKCQHLFQLT